MAGKRVIVVSRARDIIKEDINQLIEIIKSGHNIIKRKPESVSFEDYKIDMEKTGIFWWISEDFTGFIENLEFFSNLDVKHVVGYTVNIENIDQDKILKDTGRLIEGLSLKNKQLYFKATGLSSKEQVATLIEFIKWVRANYTIVERIQVDFSGDISDVNKIMYATQLSAVGVKNSIKINSCMFKPFMTKNMWIGHDPCVSGQVMQDILGYKMVKTRDYFIREEGCGCHKHVDLLGCNAKYVEGVDKIRKSDRAQENKKIAKITKSTDTKPGKTKSTKKKAGKKAVKPVEETREEQISKIEF